MSTKKQAEKKHRHIKILTWILIIFFGCIVTVAQTTAKPSFSQVIPDTGQVLCYDTKGPIPYPQKNEAFFGQDAQYQTRPMAYRDNQDGTITDLVTGLMWSKAVDPTKVSLAQAGTIAREMTLGGYSDWRVPNIKELYSLIDFQGNTGSASRGSLFDAIPYINTDYFDFRYGDTAAGERYIDAQWLSCTQYVSTTMDGAQTLFGVNFADGRIKGYGYSSPNRSRPEKKFFARYVRGAAYGSSAFKDNQDGTVSDQATGLMWTKADSGRSMDWEQALAWAEKADIAGYTDWRLPNAKELQYIVDYERSPDTTGSAAIDPVFDISEIINEAGQKDYPYFWTATTHLDGPTPGSQGVYISFGRAMGQMRGKDMDVHGAGAQRSDPKSGQGNFSRGPQGDWIRVNNYVRLVRGNDVTIKTQTPEPDKNRYPYQLRVENMSALSDANAAGNQGERFSETNTETRPFQQQMSGRDSSQKGKPDGRQFIRRLDRNNDNRVSQDEFDGPLHHFTQLDRNKDGYLTEDEAPAGPPPGRKPLH